jgi:tRNA (mo5U34)-methyltransferase
MSQHHSGSAEANLPFEGPSPERFAPRPTPRARSESPEQIERNVARLGPWVQGPFLLGGSLRIEGQLSSDSSWRTIASGLPSDLSGARVLDLGCNAGYNSFMFSALGAEYVLGCEPSRFIEQARFLEAIYGSGVDFQATTWQQLEPRSQGRFDLVHCAGVLHRELDPVGLLARLHEMTAPGGTLLLGSMMLADPTLAELIRFVPLGYGGDREWWWVPGALALGATIEAAGFGVDRRFGEVPGPPGEFETTSGYLRATRPVGPAGADSEPEGAKVP